MMDRTIRFWFSAPTTIFLVVFLISQDFKNEVNGNICNGKTTCGDCIAHSPLCAWCWQETFSQKGSSMCDFEENLKKKKCSNIVNPKSSMKFIKNLKLSDKGAKEIEVIQIKPQEIKIRLRPNTVQSLKVEFRQAVDYPVDLYYLMDLSNSMADDKIKLALLGDKLADEMGTITSNFRLGFGSFVDKTVAPYVNTHPDKLREPCPGCASPYGYRNNMPLSLKTYEFAQKVRDAPFSGNLDAPEGGFDAIMQAIVCKNEIAWRNKSRKLLVFSTDNNFHYAGDGKLGGIIVPNDEKCHLDRNGYYTKSTELDYPSLSQINRQIREHKINIIFAVTSDQVDLYEKLSRRLTGSSTGRLDADSANVVDLVRKQYNKITSSVEMTDDVGDSNVRLTYYSKCLGTKKEKTQVCRGLKVETNVTFEVNLEYTFCPKDRKQWNRTFHIFPVGLQDLLTIHLEMMCECDCEKPEHEEPFSDKCSNGNGTFECGICNCNDQRYGKLCECDASQTDPFLEDKGCYRMNDTKICSGLGTCRCGQCDCHPRLNPEERIYGKFCECNNFQCDKVNGEVCSGPDHGVCDCGICKCKKGWIGEDCSCRDTTETCTGFDGKICSEHGTCKCGSCLCEEEYFGIYCHDCLTCPGMCNELQECVECWLKDQKGANLSCSSCVGVYIVPVESFEVKEREKQCSFEDEDKCRFSFKYTLGDDNLPTVFIKTAKECPSPVDVVAIVSGVSGGVVATGLFLLMIWKLLTTIHDRREWAKFENEKRRAKWEKSDNPIYKQPTSEFKNPAYRGD